MDLPGAGSARGSATRLVAPTSASVERTGDRLRFGPVRLTPGSEFRYRLVLDSALLGTFPVVEEVTGIGVPGAARSRPQ